MTKEQQVIIKKTLEDICNQHNFQITVIKPVWGNTQTTEKRIYNLIIEGQTL